MSGERAIKKRVPIQAKLMLARQAKSWNLAAGAAALAVAALAVESSSSALSAALALAAAMRAEIRVGVISTFGSAGLTAAGFSAFGVAASAAGFLAGLRPLLRLLDGVLFLGLTSFLTSLAFKVKVVPSSNVTSYSLSSSRTNETLALKNKFVPGHLFKNFSLNKFKMFFKFAIPGLFVYDKRKRGWVWPKS